jgi:hypothetical protein
MRLSRAAWPVLAGSCLLMLVVSACGSTSGSSVNGNGTAGSGSGHAGTTGDSGPNLGLAGAPGDTNTAGSSSGPQCAGNLIKADRIPLDMYVMLDVSGSMLEATVGDPNVTKWQAVSSALTDFVNDPASAGIGMGLQVFPIANAAAPAMCTSDQECAAFGPCLNRGCWPPPLNAPVTSCLDNSGCNAGEACVVIGECSKDKNYGCNRDVTATCGALGNCVVPPSVCVSATDCKPATYAAPAAAIAPLPASGTTLISVIKASAPNQGNLTPTGPALGGAIQEAKAWANAHPDHQVVAVLATDGLPTLQAKGQLCEPVTQLADIDAVVTLAGTGRTPAPSISTFVIGVIGPNDAGAPNILNAIAMSGGTNQAFIVNTQGNVQMDFRNALNQIRATGLSCDLLVPQADAGKTVDYMKVNVTFDNGSGASDLGYVKEAKNCDAKQGGWYYDVPDPTTAMPKRILTCPKTCSDFQKTDMGSVQIKLGCVTHSVVK